ncbi:TetR/AcrR family transcriptional regulator [Cellulomonas sp. KRMCY2]|uniref:TetR/AcrR family transcriptional regulator n=1 Tax=Cellulomonas sp. KRMCY2 TaxID=1304865 RepID=UPI00045E74DC|nr:TetR/AcrR family transcriptional regulator [Cellulomonas sp. KRMCY2]
MNLSTRRATPMAPDDRRSAILAATVPLLLERGVSVTTRELAQAAGVAEGTLFRVFPDKAALVRAAVGQALDPTTLLAELAAIDPDADLRHVVTAAVGAMLARSRDVAAVVSLAHELSAGTAVPDAGGHGHHPRPHGPHGDHTGAHPIEVVIQAVTGLLEPHRAVLRDAPGVCARLLVAFVLAASGPMCRGPEPQLTTAQIVRLFLDGATTDGATTDGATTDGATTDGATTDGATNDRATNDRATDAPPVIDCPVNDRPVNDLETSC